jgi:L-alanine-DL-glutamate epimerase-like enolase superfamily enzyme
VPPADEAVDEVVRVEVRTVGADVARFRWDDKLPEFFCTNTVVRVVTASGAEGVSGMSNYTNFCFDRFTAECTRHIVPILVGKDPLLREELWQACKSRVWPYPPQAQAVVDVALWDLAGKKAGLPIYQLLGGHAKSIRAYTSTPMFDTVAMYIEWVEWAVAQGFCAVKFHCWNVYEKDLELVRAVRERFPSLTLMLDVENNYSFSDAKRMAAELTALGGFEWFEAPIPDSDTTSYKRLCRDAGVDIIPSGNWVQDLPSCKLVFLRAPSCKIDVHCVYNYMTDLTGRKTLL